MDSDLGLLEKVMEKNRRFFPTIEHSAEDDVIVNVSFNAVGCPLFVLIEDREELGMVARNQAEMESLIVQLDDLVAAHIKDPYIDIELKDSCQRTWLVVGDEEDPEDIDVYQQFLEGNSKNIRVFLAADFSSLKALIPLLCSALRGARAQAKAIAAGNKVVLP